MSFVFTQKALFKHCDLAGIVFYPRYFEMINDAVETFFDTVLDHPFETLHGYAATPVVEINVKFLKPARHGDILNFGISLTKIGRSSIGVCMPVECAGQRHLDVTLTLVWVDQNLRPAALPDALRHALQHYQKETEHD